MANPIKVHFLGVSRPIEQIREMERIYMTALFNELGGEYGVIDARESPNPVRWLDAKYHALDEVMISGHLTAEEAWNITVVVTNG